VPLEDGSIRHAEIRVGDTIVLAFDQRRGWPDTPSMTNSFAIGAQASCSSRLGSTRDRHVPLASTVA
jgi:hypothetical protein